MAVPTKKGRVSVPVSAGLRQQLRDHPEAFGFDADASEASILAHLVGEGARARREAVRLV